MMFGFPVCTRTSNRPTHKTRFRKKEDGIYPLLPARSFTCSHLPPPIRSNLQLIVISLTTIIVNNSIDDRSRRLRDLGRNLLCGALGSALGRLLGRLSRRHSLLGHTVRDLSDDVLVVVCGGRGVALVLQAVDAVGAVVADELCEVLDGAGAGVVDRGGLLAGGVELDGRETLDLVGDVVGGGVNLGDDDLVLLAVESAELLVLGGETAKMLDGFNSFGSQMQLTPCSVRTTVHRTRPRHPCHHRGQSGRSSWLPRQ